MANITHSIDGTRAWSVLIVEDDVLMRSFFSGCVSRCERLRLLAALDGAAHAMAFVQDPANVVDVLLVDLGLPDGNGLDVIRHARRCQPQCDVLVVSMFGDEDNVLSSIEAGAMGYIHKDAQPDDIAQTILEMKSGASPISPMIARRVLAKYRCLQTQAQLPADPVVLPMVEGADFLPLSSKEREVLELIARGFSYNEIAELQGVSVHTIRSHIRSLYGKLSVHSRSEAVFEATKLGLLPQMSSRG